MKSLKEQIFWAEEKKVAIGHFNISNLEGFWAIVNASKKMNLPVIIGLSEGERNFVGAKQVKALVDSVREDGAEIYLNADHTYTLDGIREVVSLFYDEVIIDAADKPFGENAKIVRDAVLVRDKINKDVLVEAELGFIGKSSKLLDEIPEGAEFSDEMMTKPDEAKRFVEETSVDLIAPAVGNIHGMVKGGNNPKINIQRIKEIRDACGVPLVLHGGSGITDEEFRGAITAGVSIIHINTELRIAYKNSIQKSFENMPDEVAPYKYMKPAVDAMQNVIENRLAIFNFLK